MVDEKTINPNGLVIGKIYRFCHSRYSFLVQVSETPDSAWTKVIDIGQEFMCLSSILEWDSGIDGVYPMVNIIGTNKPIVGWATFCDTDEFIELTGDEKTHAQHENHQRK